MKRVGQLSKLVFALAIIGIVSTGCESSEQHSSQPKIDYPVTKKVDTTDKYFGTVVEDPYRWLEHLDSKQTEQWVKKQNAVTMPYLEKLPQRESIEQQLEAWWDYPK